jgi:hypothetical protein
MMNHKYTDNLTHLELGMMKNHDRDVKEKADTSMSLETVIAMGLFGWIALSMALMGLGIW